MNACLTQPPMSACLLLARLRHYHKGMYYGYKLTHAQTFGTWVTVTRQKTNERLSCVTMTTPYLPRSVVRYVVAVTNRRGCIRRGRIRRWYDRLRCVGTGYHWNRSWYLADVRSRAHGWFVTLVTNKENYSEQFIFIMVHLHVMILPYDCHLDVCDWLTIVILMYVID